MLLQNVEYARILILHQSYTNIGELNTVSILPSYLYKNDVATTKFYDYGKKEKHSRRGDCKCHL